MPASRPAVFTPSNEPYLGRAALHQLDLLIVDCLKQNTNAASQTHGRTLSAHQKMACQVIPQAVSIALSIRELVRQGYLFGAHVLVRPFVERVAILLYLLVKPSDIQKWNRGWHHGDAPSLAKMFEEIQRHSKETTPIRGRDLTAAMNSLTHGKPDSASWNLISLADGRSGHASSKILNRPDLCDDLCKEVIPWLIVTAGMMLAYFANDSQPTED